MSDETLITESAPAAAAAPVAIATPAAPAVQAAKPSEATLLDDAPAVEAKPAEGDKLDAEAKPAAPDKYEFKAPDGKDFDSGVLGVFSEAAKSANLTQDAAQSMLDAIAPALAEKQARVLSEAREAWKTEATADKEFGGDKLAENLAVAKKALDAFGTPELGALLKASGLGNHPEVVRLLYRAGKAISEDSFVGGRTGAGAPSTAQRLYPNMNP
jgi:hypothetical protein